MSPKTASVFLQNKPVIFSAVVMAAVALRVEIAAAIARRRSRAALNKLDDYMLKDIGISRSDIDRISSRTLHQ